MHCTSFHKERTLPSFIKRGFLPSDSEVLWVVAGEAVAGRRLRLGRGGLLSVV